MRAPLGPRVAPRLTMQSALRAVVAGSMALLLSACTAPSVPPYDDLPLRDALLADPAAVSGVPDADRRKLADRLMMDGDAAHDPQRLAIDPAGLAPADLIARIDADRTPKGEDAWVLVQVRAEGSGSLVARPVARRDDRAPALPELPPVEGDAPPPETRELEARALSGRAGDVLRALLEESGAVRVVRVVAWPSAVVALGDTLYVNGSWLVAMSAIEDRDRASQMGATTLRTGTWASTTTAKSAPLDAGSGDPSSAAVGGGGGGCGGGGGGSNCGSSSSNCGSTSSNCGSSSCSSSGCGQGCNKACACSAAPADVPPYAPLSAAAWLLAPALLVAARGRRAATSRA
jgi:hypothetical protein